MGYKKDNLKLYFVVSRLHMPAEMPIYRIPELLSDETVLGHLLSVDERLVRLDERAAIFQKTSNLRSPWSERLLYRNACAGVHAQGGLVHLEDLMLLDSYAFSGVMSPDLSCGFGNLRLWKAALKGEANLLLRSPMPGEAHRPLALEGASASVYERPDAFYDPEWDQAGRLERWREAMAATSKLPPLLAAAIAWDAWHALMPEQQGSWRATLLAALVLNARGRCNGWMVPLDTGQWVQRRAWRATDAAPKRIAMFLDVVEASVLHATKELTGLAAARERLLLRLKGLRKNSKLPDLVELLISRPLVSIPMAQRAIRVSKQAVARMLSQLGSTPREISERRRYRCWTVP